MARHVMRVGQVCVCVCVYVFVRVKGGWVPWRQRDACDPGVVCVCMFACGGGSTFALMSRPVRTNQSFMFTA